MAKLYLFPILEENKDLAKQYQEQILDEIKQSYPICEYQEDVEIVNLTSKQNGVKFVELDKKLPSAIKVIDCFKTSARVRDLVSVVTDCLDNKEIKHNSPLEFAL